MALLIDMTLGMILGMALSPIIMKLIKDFRPLITRISKTKPLSVVVADKEYDSEDNHVMVIEKLKGFSVISPRHEKDVPIWKTRGRYRKEMKCSYSRFCTLNVTKMKVLYQSLNNITSTNFKSKND